MTNKVTVKKEADLMLKATLDQQKLNDYSVCYDKRLQGFKNKKFIKRLCRHYYGKQVLKYLIRVSAFAARRLVFV